VTELHTKYRPKTFDELIGHDAVAAAVQKALDKGTARSFLFTGEPGLGKTTFARVIADHLGLDPTSDSSNYIEYDGATNTGVDDMRAILDKTRLLPLSGKRTRVIVIDEAHMLSKQAWNSALKVVEEPPPDVYWVFCTSELRRVPASIRSRCQEFILSELSDDDIAEIVCQVIDDEQMTVKSEVTELVIQHAEGRPRKALVALGQVEGLNFEDARRVLSGTTEEGHAEVIDLCRRLAKGSDYPALAKTVLKLQGEVTADAVRAQVLAYFTKAAGGQKWRQAAAILTAFGTPYPQGIGNQLWPVLVSLAELFEE